MEKRSFEVICPHCGSPLAFEDRHLRETMEVCPNCHSPFVLEIPFEDSSDDARSAGSKIEDEPENAVEIDRGNDGSLLLGIPAFPLIVTLCCVVFLLASVITLLVSKRVPAPVPDESGVDQTISESEIAESFPPSSEDHPAVDDIPTSQMLDQIDSDEGESDITSDETESFEVNQYADFAFPTEDTEDNEFSPDSPTSSNEESPQADSDEPSDSDDILALSETRPTETDVIQTVSEDSDIYENPNDRPGDNRDEAMNGEENFDVTNNEGGDVTVQFSTMSRSLSEPVNVAKRLDLNLSQIRLNRAGLADFIRLFYELTGIPVQLDWLRFSEPVDVWEKRFPYEGTNLTSLQFLEEFTSLFDLNFALEEDRVLLTCRSSEENNIEIVTFDCSDLIENESERDQTQPLVESIFSESLSLPLLANALRDLVIDQTLVHGENSPTLVSNAEKKSMTLSADRRTLENARVFFDRLRSLRHLPPKYIPEAEVLIPENICWENKLTVPVSLCLLSAVPLSEALLLLERGYQIHFFFDYAAIPGGGASLETPVRLITTERPMEQVLMELLSPLGLEYVVLTEDLVAVTSGVINKEFDAEIHFYATPNDSVPLEEAAALADRIRKTIAPDSWQSDSKPGGKIWIDPESRSFYIRQTIVNQNKIRRFLQSGLAGKENSL